MRRQIVSGYVSICRECNNELGPFSTELEAIGQTLMVVNCKKCGFEFETAIDFEVIYVD